MVEVFRSRVIDLTDEELARCRELSYGDEGYMCEDLDRIRMDERGWHYRYSQAILLRLNGHIIGWALLEPIYRKRRWTAHFFVDEAHRRRGYGATLLHEANKICRRPYCFKDIDNEDFFNKYEDYCIDYQEMSS